MKKKTIDQLAETAAKSIGTTKGTVEYDYFRAGFCYGIRAQKRRDNKPHSVRCGCGSCAIKKRGAFANR